MSVSDMRKKLMNITKYNRAPAWIMKVRKMPDNQVIAVYHKMVQTGEFDKKKPKQDSEYRQMDIFEFID